MKSGFGMLLLVAVLAGVARADESPRITAHERAQGWRLLFDGTSFRGWHSYGENAITANWQVQAGTLACVAHGRALVTDEAYADFELTFAWKVEEGGRAEVYFRLAEDAELPAHTGPVFQLAGAEVQPGGNGGLIEPWRPLTVAPDTWYRAKLVVYGKQVEHWINGGQVAGYLLESAEWRAAVAASRYRDFRDYGRLADGPVAFSGRGAQFRDIKLRRL